VFSPAEHFSHVTPPSFGSLDNNSLTGPPWAPDTSGVIKLAEALPQTKLQSLR